MATKKTVKKPAKRKRIKRTVKAAGGTLTHTKRGRKEKVKWTKAGHGSPQTDNIEELSDGDPLTSNPIAKAILEEPEKRIYRKRKNYPDPDSDAGSQANSMTKKLGPRVSEKHLELFNLCADQCDTGRSALEQAIELLAEKLEIDDP